MTRVLGMVRVALHEQAQSLTKQGHDEAAAALWAIVDALDDIIVRLALRRD